MKLKMVDPIRSLRAKLQQQHQPRNPFFCVPNKNFKNPHGIGFSLPGEVRNPKGYFGPDIPIEMMKARYLNNVRLLANRGEGGRIQPMPNKKPKKPGRSPEGLKIAKDAREIQELARLHGPEAIKAMGDILRSKVASDLAKISASNALLDRGYGKALQTSVSATVNTDGSTKEIDGEELDRRVKEAVERVEKLTKRKREKIISPERPADLRKLN